MSDQDELLLGTAREPVRDSDGDGVSDTQETLDGTDPNDAGDSIRHDDPALAPRDTNDPRGDLHRPGIDEVVDVTSTIPDGKSIEQALPNGLDGKAIPTGPNHHGNADADKFFDGHSTDQNSPLNMERNPLTPVATPTQPGTGQAQHGSGSFTTAVGVANTGSSTSEFSSGNIQTGPPPGEPPSGSADPDNNMGLVSAEVQQYVPPVTPPKEPPKAADTKLKKFDKAEETWGEKWDKLFTPAKKGGMDNLGEVGNKRGSVDPDADTYGGTPSADDVARAIAVRDGATDVVHGHETPQIDTDAPPSQKIDLVTDGGDGDASIEFVNENINVPGVEISHTINPNDGIGPTRDVTGGGGQNGGGQGDGGQGDGQPGLVGVSSAATAADASSSSNASGSGVVNIGTGSTGGINSLDNSEGTDSEGDGNDSGLVSQSSAMMAGDDDDLEELEVQRADMAAAGPGTQTEDEIYIGATSAPVDPSGSSTTGGSTGADAPVDQPAAPVAHAEATVAEIFAPVVDLQFAAEVIPDPLDPVAAAMGSNELPTHEAPTETFAVLEVDLDLPVPAEVDLDDGV